MLNYNASGLNRIFHYYILHFLAERGGFSREDAKTIAWSSQFVDGNILSFTVDRGGKLYDTIPTQNYGFWNDYFPRNVYLPFHFIPGDPAFSSETRKDGKTDTSVCSPGSPQGRELFIRALKSGNPYRIGIGAHAYADTWAHQNFSGFTSPLNMLREESLIPPIGHAQALKSPDSIGTVWEDPRLIPEKQTISNKKRFFAAAKMIYKFFRTHNRLDYEDVDTVLLELELLLDKPGMEPPEDEEIAADFHITFGTDPFSLLTWIDEAIIMEGAPPEEEYFAGYSRLLWLKDILLYRSKILRPKPVKGRKNFFSSPFFIWMEAAKEHLAAAKEILRNT